MTVVCIGKFDALHLGHRSLIAHGAHLNAGPVIVLGFDGMAEVLGWSPRPPLCDTYERNALLQLWSEQLGEQLAWQTLPFADVRGLDADGFLALLRQTFHIEHIVTGQDFRFGMHRSCGIEDLAAAAQAAGVTAHACAMQSDHGGDYSSSRVRMCLSIGSVQEAASILGRPYALRGRVHRGDGRGRQIGFPTANLVAITSLIPSHGVYACWAELAGKRYAAAVNIGVLPTIDDNRQQTVEAHVLDYVGSCYAQELRLEFISLLRGEQKFTSLDQLIDQIHKDVRATRRLLLG